MGPATMFLLRFWAGPKSGFSGHRLAALPRVRATYGQRWSSEAPPPRSTKPQKPEAPGRPLRPPEAPRLRRPLPPRLRSPCQDDNARRITEFLTGLLEHMDSPAQVKVTETGEGPLQRGAGGPEAGPAHRPPGRDPGRHPAADQLCRQFRPESASASMWTPRTTGPSAKQSLESSRPKVAGKVTKISPCSVTLEPMNAYERHVIHAALQDVPGVNTYSIGTEPNRRVVVSYDRDKR